MDKQPQANVGYSRHETIETEMEQLLFKFQDKVDQLGKAISHQKDEFRYLDTVANNLNPDAFHKNIVSCGSEIIDCSDPAKIPSSTKSGIVLRFHKCIQELESFTLQICSFTNDEIKPTVTFFKQQI